MNKLQIIRDIHLLELLQQRLALGRRHLSVLVGIADRDPAIQGNNVRAGDADKSFPHLEAGGLLGLLQRAAYGCGRFFQVHDHSLVHAFGGNMPETGQTPQVSFIVKFADQAGDLGGTHIEGDHRRINGIDDSSGLLARHLLRLALPAWPFFPFFWFDVVRHLRHSYSGAITGKPPLAPWVPLSVSSVFPVAAGAVSSVAAVEVVTAAGGASSLVTGRPGTETSIVT